MNACQGLVKTILADIEDTRSFLDNSIRYCLRSYYEKTSGENPSTAVLRAEVEDDLDLQRGFLSVDKVRDCRHLDNSSHGAKHNYHLSRRLASNRSWTL